MPVIEFVPAGISEGKRTNASSNNIATARAKTTGGSVSDDTLWAAARKQGSNYVFWRGQLIFDFSQGPQILRRMGRKIKIVRAALILSDGIVNSADTGGNKLVISHIHNPNSYGTWHSKDFDRARMSKHTSAKVITNGEDNKLFSLDNRGLLRELES